VIDRSEPAGETEDQADESPKGGAERECGDGAELEQADEDAQEVDFHHIPAPRLVDAATKERRAGQSALPQERDEDVEEGADEQGGCSEREEGHQGGQNRESLLLQTGDASGEQHFALPVVGAKGEKWEQIGKNEEEGGGEDQRAGAMHRIPASGEDIGGAARARDALAFRNIRRGEKRVAVGACQQSWRSGNRHGRLRRGNRVGLP